MSFSESVKICFLKYVQFSGRARRPEYWWFALFVFVGAVVLAIADAVVFGTSPETGESRRVLSAAFQLATFLPLLAAGWRRMHDAGYPGWYLLLPMFVSLCMFLALFTGIFAFGVLEGAVDNPDALRGPAAAFGITGMVIAAIVQIGLSLLILWWLTRPSQSGSNAYGDPV